MPLQSPSLATQRSVTILLHTRNRGESLLRTLDHFERELGGGVLRVLVLDASTEPAWAAFAAAFEARRYSFAVELRHADAATPLRDRLIDGAAEVTTPYVMLAADDDFYAFDWLDEAAGLLDRDPTLGTVHGHVLFFDLDSYQAYGRMERIYVHPRRDPPMVWLEQDDAAERLAALSTGGEPSVVGWYALQRTDILRAFLDAWRAHDVPQPLIEYLIVFAQAMHKTRMLDRIILARQGNARVSHAYADVDADPGAVPALLAACRDLWRAAHPDGEDGEAAIQHYLDGPLAVCRKMSGSGPRRRAALARTFPRALGLYRRLRAGGGVPAPDRDEGAYSDPRLPARPPLREADPLVRTVRSATAPR